MFRLLAWGILVVAVFIGAIMFGLEVEKDPGLVQVQIRGWSIETSLAIAALTLVGGFVAFYAALRFLGQLTPGKLRKRTRHLRQRGAQRALQRGMTELSQGQWLRAERALTKATQNQDTAVMGYLMSARAAQALGNTDGRDKYLRLAHQNNGGGNPDIAIGITEAQLLIQGQELEKAAHLLRELHDKAPKNTLILQLLRDCYLENQAWEHLAALMPKLEKAKIVNADEALALERTAYTHMLAQAAVASDDSRALDATWCKVPHGLRRDRELVAVYIRYLIEHGENTRPESLLRHKIRAQWNDDLVYLYGFVDGGKPAQQLHYAERWLKRHSDNPTLLLTLGRLALRNHLWGKARSYLEKSAELDPRPETFMLLGKLLEQNGETAIAGDYFRKGLGISVNKELAHLERLPIESAEKSQALAPQVAAPTLTAVAGGKA